MMYGDVMTAVTGTTIFFFVREAAEKLFGIEIVIFNEACHGRCSCASLLLPPGFSSGYIRDTRSVSSWYALVQCIARKWGSCEGRTSIV
jgi:hypothetical protein